MNVLKLLSAFLKVNIQMSLAYRADTVVNILLNLMWLGWELLSLGIIFNNTETIGGWGFGELIALLGVFRLVHTLMIALLHCTFGCRTCVMSALCSLYQGRARRLMSIVQRSQPLSRI